MSAETDDASPEVDLINSIEPDAISDEGGAESEVSATVGSTGALDKTLEDFAANDKSRGTGFMGKNSEITWLQRLNQENKFGESSGINLTPDAAKRAESGHHKSSYEVEDNVTISQASYHLDDFAMPSLDAIDAYEPRHVLQVGAAQKARVDGRHDDAQDDQQDEYAKLFFHFVLM